MKEREADVIVVGGGHAGCEAALACARMGAGVLLLTLGWDAVAAMPCNPSIGGPGKAQLVREIDALGGEMGRNIDATYLQMRLLNTGKGPAVRSLRAQADKTAYAERMREVLRREPNLAVEVAHVVGIEVGADGAVSGVVTRERGLLRAAAVIIATGTYLGGTVHVGERSWSSGPQGQPSAQELGRALAALGLRLARFKTGTSPRVRRDSVDVAKMQEQHGEVLPFGFSFDTEGTRPDQELCWLTYTTPRTHEIIRANLGRAPLYTGAITGRGPRYCPSIETKVVQFPARERHQVFLEPETRDGDVMYLGGLSTSLPADVQEEMVHSVPGLEEAEILRPGYAIEYDCLVPTELLPSLETKKISGLFAAGQINGTSGYEEAASQGLMAGINAVLKIRGKEPLVLERSEAYIGVLIDDLVTKGTCEPYRMMTSRAEYRLTLRQDNADLRLTEKGHQVGLVPEERYERFLARRRMIEDEMKRLGRTVVPGDARTARLLAAIGTAPLQSETSLADLLARPEVSYDRLAAVDEGRPALPQNVVQVVEIELKYAGYIRKQKAQIERARRLEARLLPPDTDYRMIAGLSREAVEKLSEIRPRSIGQAARISGVSPADIMALLVYVESGRRRATIGGLRGA
ncbi:MAG TPA: tRNA uridine-5-carboxymethylaminomethyl(34) synthesis enzyme MnmG [Firmicutes bacterium]|nr:tRNA uridine-5-carboxymethylaminomethyl(34) synthesis enzyme MnmG [Bacillota bacterium]